MGGLANRLMPVLLLLLLLLLLLFCVRSAVYEMEEAHIERHD